MDDFNALDREGSAKADALHRKLKEYGVDFASGVPCGVLRHVIGNLDHDGNVTHVRANRESEAVGIAAGAYLAGKHPVLYMQNSGLFAASNDIASLLVPYRIPVLMLVTFRGAPGEDAVQHFVTGASTLSLLRSFGLPHAVYDGTDIGLMAGGLFGQMAESGLPGVLLLKRGWQR